MEEEVKYLDLDGLQLYHRNLNNKLAEKANVADLANVATTGNYSDLINSPTNVSVFNNDAGYITSEIDNTNGHEFVEIGGLKWATMNIGAESITDTGLYFQWGDIEGYTVEEVGVEKNFIWDDYKFNPSGDGSTFTKYNATDEKTSLDLEDDPVAHAWGSDWRTPTYEEFQAFKEAVDTEWTDDYEESGIAGLICTDKEDSSKVIFFPAAGLCSQGSIISDTTEGFYYTKSLSNTVSQGIGIGFDDNTVNWNISHDRCLGYCIRGILNGPATRTIMGVTLAEKDIWNAKVSAEELEEAIESVDLSAGKGIIIENNTVSIDDTVQVVITINSAPTSSTLTYTVGLTQYNFKIGDEVRVPNLNVPTGNHGYIYYKLFDLVTENNITTAYWCIIGSGSLEGFYTPTLSEVPTESTITYTKDGQTLTFEIGQFCRVANEEAPLGYVFYLLYDLTLNGTVAKWNLLPTRTVPKYTAPTAPLTTPIYNGTSQPIIAGGNTEDGTFLYSLNGTDWNDEIPRATNVGEYTVYWKLAGDGLHTDIPTSEFTVEILPMEVEDPTITLSIDEYTYDGQACIPSVTLTDDNGDFIPPDQYTVTYSNNINAGTATVTVIDNGKNYRFNSSTTFTINKAAGSVTTIPVDKASIYNESAQSVANAGEGTGTMMYRLGDTGEFSSTMPTIINAGTYTLYYYAAESDNYLQSATDSIEVTILKAAPTYSSPTAKTLTYNENAQDLLNAGSTLDGTIQYSSNNGTTWSTTIPQATNAGNYTLQWKLIGDNNHTDIAAATINVTINKANPSYTAPTGINGLIYNATALDLLNAGTTSDGTIYYSKDNKNWSLVVPKETNVNTYNIYWKLEGDSNHINVETSIISVSIAKVTPTVTAPTAKTLIYNTQSLILLNAGATNWGTLEYSDDGTTYNTTIPSKINAGTYTLYYKVVGNDNVNNVAPVKINATISKVTPTVTAPTAKTGLIYNGTAQNLINAGSTNYGTLNYSLDNVTYSTNIPKGTNVNTYYIYYKVVGDSNINDVAELNISVSITKVTPTVTAPTPKTLTFNGTAQELINAGSTNFGTLQYKVGTDSWSTSIPTRTKGGSYELLYKVVGDSNVNDVASDSVVCSISEKPITATVVLSQNSYTYDGTEKKPTVTVKDGSTIVNPSEYGVTYSNNINTGTATVTIYDNTGGDYNVIGSATFTITKANGSVTTVPTAKSLTYSGSAQTLANAGSGTGTMYYSLNETSGFSTTIPTGTNAGNYTVYYYAAESTNYNQSATDSISVTIAKANGSVTTAPTAKTLTYSSSALTLANAGSGTGTMYYSLSSSSGFSTTIPTGTNATSYTVYYYAAESSNYNLSSTGNISVSIKKADPTYTAPTAKSPTYSGSAQALLNAGSTNHGTIQYSSNNSTWSTTIPTGTNASTYTSYWRLVGDSNHNDKASTSISTTISKANQAAPTASVTAATYPGTSTASASGGGGLGTLSWTKGSSRSAIGTQDTYAYWAGNSNYNASPNSNKVTLSVSKYTPTVTLSATDRAYNGSALYATASVATPSGGTTTKGTIYYGTSSGATTYSVTYSGSGSVNLSSVSVTNVGSATVYAYFVPDSSCNTYYNNSGNVSKTFTISKANLSAPTASGDTVAYHNTATATATGGGGQGTLTWTNGNTRTAVGSQDTYAYWAGNNNYNASPNSNKATLTVNKATDQSVTVTRTNRTYNSSGQVVASATSHGCTFYLGFGSSSSSAPSSWGSANSSISQTNAGTYYIWYKASADGNHSADISATYSGTVTINKATLDAPTATGATTTYNTTATATASGGGSIGSIEWSNGNTLTSVGSKKTKARWSGNSNYNASAWSNEVTLTMNKANQNAPTATVTTATYPGTSTASASGGGGQGTLTWTNGSSRTAIGTQDTYAYWAGNGNYNASPNSNKVTLSVAKFTPTVTLAVTNRAYNGNALYATASVATPSGGVATKGTIYYGTSAGATTYSVTYGGSGSVNLSSVSVTNVGSATVYAYFAPDSSCNSYYNNSGNASKTFTVSKANQSAPTATGATTTFHNTATATASGGGGQGTLTWTNGNTRTAIGTTATAAYWAGNSNYNASPNSNSVNLVVNKATDQSITVTLTNRTYNGKGQVVASASAHGISNYYLGFGSSATSAPSSWGSANSSISLTNAGTYYVWYKGTADGNHSADIGATYKGTVTIGKANQSAPTATGATTTYNTTATASASGGGGQGSIEWSNGNTLISVGSKTTKARWSGNSNYNASPYSNEVTLTMNKANLSAPTATGAITTYPTTATASASGGGGAGSIEWESAQSLTSVGSHTTRARWSGNGNYNASPWSGYVTVQMTKASGSITKDPSAKSLTYNGLAQELLNAGSGTGTLMYRIGSGNFSSSIPKGTDAGAYTIQCYAAESTNYNKSATTTYLNIFIINKANLDAPTATGATTTYNTTATATASGGGGKGSIEWSNGSTQASVGSKNTLARWSGNSNYNASSWSNVVTITMNKANGSVTTAPTNRGVSWTGSAQNLVNAGSGTGTMYYSLNGGAYSTSIPTATDPGSYTIHYYAAASTNYTLSSTGSLTATISSIYNGFEFIDLGLPSGLKWAKFNIGANTEYSYNTSYFSWGNTTAYYKDSGSTVNSSVYNSTAGSKLTGNIPANSTYDAAKYHWGGNWRMPTTEEFQELFNNCTPVDANGNAISSSAEDKRTTMSGVIGLRLKSNINGKFIFFPCSGFYQNTGTTYYAQRGEYWTSSLYDANQGTIFYIREYALNARYYESRWRATAIRPVC